MIWDLLEVISSPQDYAIRVVNGEIHIRPKSDVNRMQQLETTMSDSTPTETAHGQFIEALAKLTDKPDAPGE